MRWTYLCNFAQFTNPVGSLKPVGSYDLFKTHQILPVLTGSCAHLIQLMTKASLCARSPGYWSDRLDQARFNNTLYILCLA